MKGFAYTFQRVANSAKASLSTREMDELDGGGSTRKPGALLLSALVEAHVFHLERGTLGALQRTKNEPRIVPLPFASCFLDAEIHVGRYVVRGVNIFALVHNDGKLQMAGPEHVGEPYSPACSVVYHHADPGPDVIVPVRHLWWSWTPDQPGGDFLCHVGGPTEGWCETPTNDKTDRMVRAAVSVLVQNWLDILHDPEVVVVETAKGNNHAVRFAREYPGVVRPKSVRRIVLKGDLKKYVERAAWDEHRLTGERHYSHRFWVRGYFRTLQSPRFKNKQGQRVWTPPHVKGEGVLVRKQYAIEVVA